MWLCWLVWRAGEGGDRLKSKGACQPDPNFPACIAGITSTSGLPGRPHCICYFALQFSTIDGQPRPAGSNCDVTKIFTGSNILPRLKNHVSLYNVLCVSIIRKEKEKQARKSSEDTHFTEYARFEKIWAG